VELKEMATTKKKPIAGLELGTNYFIRGVTMYYTGRLVAMDENELVLEDAAWIADTGRFAEALKSGNLNEVEPYPDGVLVHISRGAILDISNWLHDLPRKVK
jgi:hypothetical protein